MANAALSALVASSTSVFDRPASSMASVSNSKDSHGAVSGEGDPDLTPQKQLRLRRGRSEDLSPAGKLGAKYTSPNRMCIPSQIKAITCRRNKPRATMLMKRSPEYAARLADQTHLAPPPLDAARYWHVRQPRRRPFLGSARS
jgi:hypothetical protein